MAISFFCCGGSDGDRAAKLSTTLVKFTINVDISSREETGIVECGNLGLPLEDA